MRETVTVLLSMGLAAVTGTPALAERIGLGSASFELPDGWKAEDADGGLLLSRAYPASGDNEGAGAMIQLLNVPAAPAALQANIAEMVGWVAETATDDPMVESSGETLAGHPIRMEYRCCDHSKDVPIGQTVVGIADRHEQLLAGFIFVNTSSDHEDAAAADFRALVRSIRFEGDAEGGIAPRPGDGGLQGAFTHLDVGLMPNVFGGMDFRSESEVVLFDNSGLFARALPVGADLAAHCKATPTDCGTYKVTGGGWFGGARQIEMRSTVDDFGVVETELSPLALNGDDLKIDDEDYVRLPSFEQGTRLDGSWSYTWASSGLTATTSGGVAVERTLEFGKDGRFSRDGWSGGSTSGDFGGVTVSNEQAKNTGTYDISGYGLKLETDGGETETLSIFAPDPGSDAVLVIDGDNYLKAD